MYFLVHNITGVIKMLCNFLFGRTGEVKKSDASRQVATTHVSDCTTRVSDAMQAGERRGQPRYPCDRARAAAADRPAICRIKIIVSLGDFYFPPGTAQTSHIIFFRYRLSKQHFRVTYGKFVWDVFYKGIRLKTCLPNRSLLYI